MVKHNHEELEVQVEGICPACDDYHERIRVAADPTIERFGIPNYPPTHPFRRAFG